MLKFWKVLCVLSLTFLITIPASSANDEVWQSIFNNIPSEKEIRQGVWQKGSLYNANVEYMITNGVDGKLSDTDTITMTVEGRGITPISFTGNKTQLTEWAKENKNDLFKAVFGNAPDTATSGRTSSQSLAQSAFMSSIYMAPNVSTEPAGAGVDSHAQIHKNSHKQIPDKNVTERGYPLPAFHCRQQSTAPSYPLAKESPRSRLCFTRIC
ncbi:hypothetical protein LZ24_00438 [Desulfobotulus alkaliphilus]|uniref:Uncharacterized protein n=1 Tax=Desulfobotulus alkaliphilus TaxID=622671 RepID=A0A562S8Q8_9BACT|nr:hypothetical protein [Desulfobotulus alkaliphilus]TWI76816.1 hypothetical protein LZ24_00438 [Desulfobotulus alkaliphilus]